MIQVKMQTRSGQKVLLGLDRENITRLKKGEPIVIPAENLQIDVDIVIDYADDLKELIKRYGLPAIN